MTTEANIPTWMVAGWARLKALVAPWLLRVEGETNNDGDPVFTLFVKHDLPESIVWEFDEALRSLSAAGRDLPIVLLGFEEDHVG